MKTILATTIAALGAALLPASADELTSFRICEDQRVIHTSDGAEAGRVEYIMVEPSSFRVVSAVVHGGVVADKYVAVPISVMRFGTTNEITLTNITREKLVSAPVFEATHLRAGATIDVGLVERSYSHFGVNASEITRTSSSSTTTEGRSSTTERGTTPDRNANDRRTTTDPNTTDRNAAERDALRSTRDRNANPPTPSDVRSPSRNSSETNRTPNDPNRPEANTTQPENKNFNRDPLHSGNKENTPPDNTPPGKSGSTPGQDNTAPGKSGNTPGQDETAPGKAKRSNQGATENDENNKAGKRSEKSEKNTETDESAGNKPGKRTEKSDKTETDDSSANKNGKRPAQNEADKDESTKNKKRE